jgi:hypothetical protein
VLGLLAIATCPARPQLAGGHLELGQGSILLAGGRQRPPRERARPRGVDPRAGSVALGSRGEGPFGASHRIPALDRDGAYGPIGLALFIIAVLVYVRSQSRAAAPASLGQPASP